MLPIPFTKMHSCGNDFVLIQKQALPYAMTPNTARALADRHFGVGCDLIAIYETGLDPIPVTFYNQDGSQPLMCGNALRCIADLLLTASPSTIRMHVGNKILQATRSQNEITIDMGKPKKLIPQLPYLLGSHHNIGEADMGNPHLLCLVSHIDSRIFQDLRTALDGQPWFPEGVNISQIELLSPAALRVHTDERGVGETLACGSAVCAAVAFTTARRLTYNTVDVQVPGGKMSITVQRDRSLTMRGPVSHVFTGIWQGMSRHA
jgi:diaminopimelate epimerase